MDDFLRTVWIDHILDAPSDSSFSKSKFICGVQRVAETITKFKESTRGALSYLGTWHTHPVSTGSPSVDDIHAAFSLLHDNKKPRRNIVFLIVGFASTNPDIRSFVFNRNNISVVDERNTNE